jgi:hypothetical protein
MWLLNSKCSTNQHCNRLFSNFPHCSLTNQIFCTTSGPSVPTPWTVAQPWPNITLSHDNPSFLTCHATSLGEWTQRQYDHSKRQAPLTQWHGVTIPEDLNSQKYRCENLKSHNFITSLPWRMGLSLPDLSSSNYAVRKSIQKKNNVLSGIIQNNFLTWISKYVWEPQNTAISFI